jgi:AhpD family alkylhydroperoxidase
MAQRLNWFGKRNDGIDALQKVEAFVQKGPLDKKLLALVKMRASQINGCAFCLHMHSEEAMKAGESTERLLLLNAWQESSLYTERERAALAWTEALTNIAATHAPDAIYENVRKLFSEDDLIALSIAIAMINAWNRLSIGFRAEHPSEKKHAA